MSKKLDTQSETEVVAYIARGDSYQSIINVFKTRGIVLNKTNLSKIKARNSEALTFMQTAMTEQQMSHAASILHKSRQLLEGKLDEQIVVQRDLEELKERFDNGDIEFTAYINLYKTIVRRELTAGELNGITKESFNQSQVEAGKPTAITESPTQARQNLQVILNAIANGDDKAAVEALFIDA